MRPTTFLIALATGGAGVLIAAPAAADTLREALAKAYATNPTLGAERQNVRDSDEEVPIAKAGGRPEASVAGGYTENFLNSPGVQNSFSAPERQLNGQINLTVPIVTFGAVSGAVRAAEHRAGAARDRLRGTEADLFTAVVAAYMDIIRDEAIVTLNRSNVSTLQATLKANSDRAEAGDLNPTDVSQSRARLSLAQSQLLTANGRLIASRENYIRLVGTPPGDLAEPPALPALPTDPGVAVAEALDSNPAVLGARKAREAALGDIQVARSTTMPRVNGVVGGSFYDYLGSLRNNPFAATYQANSTASVGVEVRVPLYQGGRPAAQIRQAQVRRARASEQVLEAERGAIAQTRSAFATWQAARDVIATSAAGVAANRESTQGVRAENNVGTRTSLDVLNAEQELLNSQVTLLTARRDAYVAGFALLAAMGKAEAKDLGLDSGALYDPMVNYNRVRNMASDWSRDPDPADALAMNTAATAAQDATVTRPLTVTESPVPR